MIIKAYPFVVQKTENGFAGHFPNFPDLKVEDQDLITICKTAQQLLKSQAQELEFLPEPFILKKLLRSQSEDVYTTFQICCERNKYKLGNIEIEYERNRNVFSTCWNLKVDELHKSRFLKLPYFPFLHFEDSVIRLPEDTPQRLCENFCKALQAESFNEYELIKLARFINLFGVLYFNNQKKIKSSWLPEKIDDFWGEIRQDFRYDSWN